jgi:hypothetical protein
MLLTVSEPARQFSGLVRAAQCTSMPPCPLDTGWDEMRTDPEHAKDIVWHRLATPAASR